MSKIYRIEYVINDKQSIAATKRAEAGHARIEKAATKAADAIEKGAEKSAKTAEKTAAAAVKAAEKTAAAAEKQAEREAKARERTFAKATKDAKRMSDAIIKESDKVSADHEKKLARDSALEDKYRLKDYNNRVKFEKAKERAADGPMARQAQQNRRELSQAEIHAIAKNRIMDRANKEQVKSVMKSMGVQRDLFSQGIADAFGFGASLTAVSVTAAGMVAGFKGLELVSAHYHKISTDARAAADATFEMQKALRVEGVLKGEPTATPKVLAESLKLRAETGLTAADATELTRQYLGSLPIGLEKKNITPEVAKDLMTQVGITQARMGGEAGTRGDLAGVLGQFGRVKSVEAGLGQMEAIRLALTEGRGDDTPLTNQLLQAAGGIVREGGKVESLPEMAALIGTVSLTAKGHEATAAQRIHRAMTAGITKHSKAKGQKSDQAAYMKSIGVDEKDPLEVSLPKVMADLKKAQDAGRDPTVYLAERGFRSSEEREELVALLPNIDVLLARMKKAREGSGEAAGKRVLEESKEFLASPMGGAMVAEALGDVGTATAGLAGGRFKALYKAAEKSPEIREGDKALWTSTVGDWLRGVSTGTYWGATEAGKKERIEEKVFTDLTKKAKAAGVSPEELAKARRESYGAPDIGAEYTRRVSDLIEGRGGSTAIDTRPHMDALTKALEAMTLELKKGVAGAPAGAPGRAVVPGPGAPVALPPRPDVARGAH